MTAITSPLPRTAPSPGGVAAIVAGGLFSLLALVLATVGAISLWGHSQKGADGFISTGTDRYQTATYALATSDLDFDDVYDGFGGDAFGTVRLRATSNEGKPVFVGVAKTADVERFLGHTRHTNIAQVDFDPFDATYQDFDGARPDRPGDQRFWAASSAGGGTQTLDWKAQTGDWSVVVMNADASEGVDVGVKAGAKLAFLEPLGYGLLGIGLLVLAAGGALIAGGVRSRR